MAQVATAPPRFEMRGVRKAFGQTVALAGVDFDVHPGEVCALVGQNGAGKSTLMSILSGALRPDAGDDDARRRVLRAASRHSKRGAPGVAMIYQSLSLAPHLSVMENIALGVEPTRWGLVRRDDVRQASDGGAGAARSPGHPARDAAWAGSRRRASNSSKSRARSDPGAVCWCSTNPPAVSATTMCGGSST